MSMYEEETFKIMLDRIVDLAGERAEMKDAMYQAQSQARESRNKLDVAEAELARLKAPWPASHMPPPPPPPDTSGTGSKGDLDMPF
jgi:hypothetical protein